MGTRLRGIVYLVSHHLPTTTQSSSCVMFQDLEAGDGNDYHQRPVRMSRQTIINILTIFAVIVVNQLYIRSVVELTDFLISFVSRDPSILRPFLFFIVATIILIACLFNHKALQDLMALSKRWFSEKRQNMNTTVSSVPIRNKDQLPPQPLLNVEQIPSSEQPSPPPSPRKKTKPGFVPYIAPPPPVGLFALYCIICQSIAR